MSTIKRDPKTLLPAPADESWLRGAMLLDGAAAAMLALDAQIKDARPKTTTKPCTKCHEAKLLTEFDARKGGCGTQSECRVCRRASQRALTPERRVRVRETTRQWAHEHVEQLRESQRNKPRPVPFPEREVARALLRNAVKSGKVRKPTMCTDCGKPTKPRVLHGHHTDYSRPFDVSWLCSLCHGLRHRADPPTESASRPAPGARGAVGTDPAENGMLPFDSFGPGRRAS